MANIGAIVGGGFALIRRRPSAVLCWGAISTVALAALGYAQMRITGSVGAGMAVEWSTAGMSSFAVQMVFGCLSLFVSVTLSAAVFRAVLWPEARGGVASIRFGMDEVRLIGLTLILYVLSMAAGLVGGLGLAFLTTLVGFLFGGSPAVAGLLGMLITVAMMCLTVFLLVRLSVVYPLVLVRRRIGLDAAWELTRGHFWSLFGAYVLISMATAGLIFLLFLPLIALGAWPGGTKGPYYWPAFFQQLNAGNPQMVPVLVVTGLIAGSLLYGIMLALWGGGIATAAKDLLGRAKPVLPGEEKDVAELD